jgi:hypothetical protein
VAALTVGRSTASRIQPLVYTGRPPSAQYAFSALRTLLMSGTIWRFRRSRNSVTFPVEATRPAEVIVAAHPALLEPTRLRWADKCKA